MGANHPLIINVGGEEVDLRTEVEPISLDTFQQLMDEEPDKPFFVFAVVRSGDDDDDDDDDARCYRHLYAAENVIQWYPLEGTTDPCTRGKIVRVEYWWYAKGRRGAIHVGDVYEDTTRSSKSADYAIWSFTAEDEPSRMMGLLSVAFLFRLGRANVRPDDVIDTSPTCEIAATTTATTSTDPSIDSSPVDREDPKYYFHDDDDDDNDDDDGERHANEIYGYVRRRISKLIENKDLVCSDPDVLLASIKYDVAHHIAALFVSLDPNLDVNSEDFSKIPHIRQNAVTMDILIKYALVDVSAE